MTPEVSRFGLKRAQKISLLDVLTLPSDFDGGEDRLPLCVTVLLYVMSY